jgi:hypothetical protein
MSTTVDECRYPLRLHYSGGVTGLFGLAGEDCVDRRGFYPLAAPNADGEVAPNAVTWQTDRT